MKNYEAIVDGLCTDIAAQLDPEDLVPELQIDAEIQGRDISSALCEGLMLLEPFGQGNPEPRFIIRNVALADWKLCGADQTHLQFRIGAVKAIAFRMGHVVPNVNPDDKFDVACRLSINLWNGQKFPQVFVDDIRLAVAQNKEVAV
jgi:single-stranded-DNA-specific exonuclease